MTTLYRAVVFDMDGVLADSEPAFFDAVNLTLEPTGKQIAWSAYKRLLGTSIEVTWSEVLSMLGLPVDIEKYLGRFDEVLLDCLRVPRPPLPGVVGVLDDLARRDIPFAVATSSIRPWYEAVMESTGLTGRFITAVTADQIDHPKPAPDIYLRAAELLGVPAGACIAVEDTIPGVASAKAAGMYAIQTRAASTALPPIGNADLVIETLEEFPLELVES
jgi:HAD superfamily hydrolase (TIGR01509 family)